MSHLGKAVDTVFQAVVSSQPCCYDHLAKRRLGRDASAVQPHYGASSTWSGAVLADGTLQTGPCTLDILAQYGCASAQGHL
jgi:hypothetical protein